MVNVLENVLSGKIVFYSLKILRRQGEGYLVFFKNFFLMVDDAN